MQFEIERKFLVREELLPILNDGIVIKQAYLSVAPAPTVRIRLWDEQAFITIKGAVSGICRSEFEYEIPYTDAINLLKLAVTNPIEKVRKIYFFEGKKWEIDFFEGDNKGLILAEVELDSENENVIFPEWVEKEVSNDIRYFNSQLALCPFNKW